jgi:hypothetical protein
MAKLPKPLLHDPPFPPLTWDGYGWEGRIMLPSWSSFMQRPADDASDVRLSIWVHDGDPPPPPSREQAAAFQYLLDHDKALADTIVHEVFEESPWDIVDDEEYDIEEPDGLRTRIGLTDILLHTVSKDGLAYVGFQFECDWYQGHGLGVMMHGDRVVAIGGADVSILSWIAADDAREA